MNNDNKVEAAIAGLNCWASYATDRDVLRVDLVIAGNYHDTRCANAPPFHMNSSFRV